MADQPVDLTNCDREPIHIPGSVQPHGVLAGCHGTDLVVTQVSDNAGTHLGRAPAEILGRSLAELLAPASWVDLAAACRAGFPRERNPLAVVMHDGRQFDAIAHYSPSPGAAIVELEPRTDELLGFHPRMRASVTRLQSAGDVGALCQIAAEEVRALTGFDRVMIYRFDQDWNGEVVAEARRDDLETFLGLHYPAADIPAQARRLYTLNWLRIIPDVAYAPARLTPAMRPATADPLDLSFAVLRSVSPIHVEYLKNMGVSASMSISLVWDGILRGLIACHHYSGPHYVPYTARETAEYLGQTLSWHVSSLEARHVAERVLASQRAESALVRTLATAGSLASGLCTPPLLELTGASGAAVVYEGETYEFGTTPGRAAVERLVDWLAEPGSPDVFVTDRLSDHLPEAAAWDADAAGVLAVDIARDLGEHVLWFRPSSERTVDWAGDPRKVATVDDGGPPRLSPRGSFALWREVVRGRADPWTPWQIEAASDLRRILVGGLRRRAAELKSLNDRLSAADRAKDEFLATVGHELRTPLNAMLGWVQLLRTGDLPGERRDRALDTIERNARAQGKLVDDILDVSRVVSGKLRLNVEPVSLSPIVEDSIESVRPAAEAKNIRLQPALDSTTTVVGDAQRLQQVVTNLLTNAVKFTPKGGRIRVLLERRDSSVDLTVADSGVGIAAEFIPFIFDRFRQADGSHSRRSGGLGLGLAIVRSIVELHGGAVTASSDGPDTGATFVVNLPLAAATRREVLRPLAADGNPLSPDCPSGLEGLRVLVVDDEMDARELLRELLERCDVEVEVATSAETALELVGTFKPDVLVSDIGMPGEDGYSLIARLRQRPAEDGGRTPAVALTAYARVEDRTRALFAGFQNHVPKPVEPAELLAVIASLSGRHGPRRLD